MILTRVRLLNVGAFEGAHELDLDTTETKPVILIGGMNGAGKTTLFNSILVCLYGRGWQRPQSIAEYEQELRSLTHRESTRTQGMDAYIEVSFQHTHLGEQQNYTVRRSWRVNDKSVTESVEVKEGAKAIEDVDPDHWNQFIRELIPRGVSNLFFFDGEKVKDLASDDEAHAIALRDAFDSLLGLDIVEQLRLDLAHVISNQKSDKSHELADAISSRNTTIRDQEKCIATIAVERDELKGKVERFRVEADKWEQELARSGGVFASKRQEYKAKEAQLEKDIKTKHGQLAELATGVLPFILSPESTGLYLAQVQREQDAVQARAAADVVGKIQKSLETRFTKKQATLEWFQGDAGTKHALAALDEAFKPFRDLPAVEIIHGYSTTESDAVVRELGHKMPQARTEARAIAADLKRLRGQLQRVRSFLSKVPDEVEHQEKIQSVLRNLGESARKAAHFEAALGEKQRELEEARAKLEKIVDDLHSLEAKHNKVKNYISSIDRAVACRNALHDYQTRLRSSRRGILQDHLVECLGLLTNKKGTYEGIQLDESLQLSVQTRDGKRLDFTELSAGERQILATALLWALSKTSGRPLPFVIDTPLGRLDSQHRGQLVERFYPKAGHQVVILSTDTEIDEDYAKQLANHVGRSYLLEFDSKTERTTVRAGYFGGKA